MTYQPPPPQATARLIESIANWYSTLGALDPRDYDLNYDSWWGSYPQLAPPYYRQNQKRGEVLPVYTTEAGLRMIRDRNRRLCAENEFAICAIENRKSYVVGKGFVYRAAKARPDAPDDLVNTTQRILDAFCEANELGEMEAETQLRMDRDGEAFIRQFEGDSGLLQLRFVEPELIRSPTGESFGPEHSFGVWCEPHDIETRKGYWVVESPLESPQPSLVDAAEIIHFKANTDRSAKRGLPTFYPVESNLRRVEDLLASMTSMAKTRAKIALIRRVADMAQSTAQQLVQGLTEVSVTDPSTSQVLNMERMRPGSILTASKNIDYEMPGAEVDAAGFVDVLECELRAIAARLVMPAWMLTANADAANFASSLVAEAPSTRHFEKMQHFLKRRFGENRFRQREALAWRQLRIAVERGVLPPAVYTLIDIQVEGPSLTVRDKAQEAEVNKVYVVDLGIKSPQTVAQEQGWDYEQEQRNRKAVGLPLAGEVGKQQAASPVALHQTFGQGGGNGQPPGKPPAASPAEPEPDGGEERPDGPGRPGLTESKDDSGHEHKGKVAGGGQFTGTGGGSGGGGKDEGSKPSAAKPEPKKFGKSKAAVKVDEAHSPETLAKVMKDIFGKKAPPIEDLASAVGAPDDAAVKIGYDTVDGKRVVTVHVDHPSFEATRYVFKNGSGVHVKNDEFWVKPQAQGQGLGADVFGRQVEQCRELGIASIRCHAARSNPQEPDKPHNGYYTWPRFGYDADIEDANFDTPVFAALQKQFPDAGTLLEVMATPEGRDWWKKNGADVYHMKFDLANGSRSMLIHDAYQSERAAKKAS